MISFKFSRFVGNFLVDIMSSHISLIYYTFQSVFCVVSSTIFFLQVLILLFASLMMSVGLHCLIILDTELLAAQHQ